MPPFRHSARTLPPTSPAVLLRLPGAGLFCATAAAGRVGVAMTGLGLLWLVQQRSGSYAAAGLVVAAFAVAEATLAPLAARLVDRHGQRRVLPPLVAAHAAAVAAVLLTSHLPAASAPGEFPLVTVALAAALAGAAVPQPGALATARWASLLRARGCAELLPVAFSLESSANALAYLVGPVLVSALASGAGPAAGTAVAAGLVVVSGAGLAGQRATAPPALRLGAARREGSRAGLLAPAFLVLVSLNVAIGGYFGAVQVAVAAFAAERGSPGAAGVLLAVSSAAGVAASWSYGLRRWRTPAARQLPRACAVLALACLGLVAAPSLPLVGLALVPAGAAVPVVLVLATVLTEARVPHQALTQAMTWLNSAAAAGSAAATGLAGHVVETGGAGGGFALAALGAAVMVAVTGAGRRVLAGAGTSG